MPFSNQARQTSLTHYLQKPLQHFADLRQL